MVDKHKVGGNHLEYENYNGVFLLYRNLTQLSRVRDWRHLSSSKSVRENLISQLSREQLNRIYQNYKVDFEMFNYTMDKYLH